MQHTGGVPCGLWIALHQVSPMLTGCVESDVCMWHTITGDCVWLNVEKVQDRSFLSLHHETKSSTFNCFISISDWVIYLFLKLCFVLLADLKEISLWDWY